MNFCQTVIAEIIGGLVSGLIVGYALYLIFDNILIKKPKLRLYIEPNEIKEREFILDFYIKNIGNLSAKDTIFTASFPDLEIFRIIKPEDKKEEGKQLKRIDEHRGGVPSIQINFENPFHPRDKSNYHIAKIEFKLGKIKEKVEIRYDIEAENMNYFEDTYIILVNLSSNV